jgi:FdhD protein
MAVANEPSLGAVPGLGYGPPLRTRDFTRLEGNAAVAESAAVAEEVPVAFVYGGRSHAVMMCTPTDLEDLAVGFSLSEEIVASATDITGIAQSRHSRGIELVIDIPADDAARLSKRARSLIGRTGCGLCGVEAIDDAIRAPRAVTASTRYHALALYRAAAALNERQPLNAETHAIHAAAWAMPDGELLLVREDVGRHNALDKVLGAIIRAGVTRTDGFAVVTSRASFELVQKAAVMGIGLLAAVSRPTGLAVELAERSGITLVGLLRGECANVYSHPSRILNPTER